jgi:hypothetical protein
MSVIIDALQYWWWNEEISVENPLTPPPSPINISKPLVEFSCSYCFKFMESETDFTKKAKISKNTFIFCDEDCYVDWLSSPGTMLLGKLN